MKPQKLQDITVRRMKALGVNANMLAAKLDGHVSRATVFNFIGGKTRTMSLDALARIWGELGLSLQEVEK